MQILIKSGEGMQLYELRAASHRSARSPGMKQRSIGLSRAQLANRLGKLEYRESERGRNDLAMAIATGNTNMLPVFPTTAAPQRPGSSRRSYPAPTSFRTW